MAHGIAPCTCARRMEVICETEHTLRNEVGSSTVWDNFVSYPVAENLLRQYWLKVAKLHIFGREVCLKEAEFRRFSPIFLQKHIFRPPDWKKNCPAL